MRAAPEQRLQRQVAAYLSWALAPPATWTAHPAGGGGEMRGLILKGLGLRAGWPDIEIVANGGRFHGVELKSEKGRLSEAQIARHAEIIAAGGQVTVCRSLDDLRAALSQWGIATRETKPSTERIRRGFAIPLDTRIAPTLSGSWNFPESDQIGRRKRRVST